MESIAIIGARGIPKDFIGTSGIEAYIEQEIPVLVKNNSVTCYIHNWAATSGVFTYLGAKLLLIPTVNTTYFDTFIYSFFSSIHAAVSRSTIVWYHGVGPAFFSFIPLLFNKKVYTTIHTRDWERKKWSLVARLFLKICEKIALACSTKIFVVSDNLEQYYKKRGIQHIIQKKYLFTNKPKLKTTSILHKYNLKKDSYILFVGRFVPEKRIEWIINTAHLLSIPVVLVGGSSHTREYENTLHKLSLNKNIIFTGYLFGKDKNELLSHCRIFALPSQTEGFPVSVVEALEFNKKCIVGDFLLGEFGDNRNVRYFDTDNYSDFLHTLLSCIPARFIIG